MNIHIIYYNVPPNYIYEYSIYTEYYFHDIEVRYIFIVYPMLYEWQVICHWNNYNFTS